MSASVYSFTVHPRKKKDGTAASRWIRRIPAKVGHLLDEMPIEPTIVAFDLRNGYLLKSIHGGRGCHGDGPEKEKVSGLWGRYDVWLVQ